jgi:hypothetical protein
MTRVQRVNLERSGDSIRETIRKALQAAKQAQAAANEDLRTSSTLCTDYLDAAVRDLESSADWYRELRQEEKANERQSLPKPEPQAKPEPDVCHICDSEIPPDDVAVCGGCDKPTCPNCMGDEGICKQCEVDED